MKSKGGIARAERDDTRAETRFRLSPKRTSPFKSAGTSVLSTTDSRGVRISFSNAGYTTFGGGVRVLANHSIHQFPLHFPSRASPCATRFRTSSTSNGGRDTAEKVLCSPSNVSLFIVQLQRNLQIFFWQAWIDPGARCWWHIWLRHCATSQKVTSSIPDGVTGICL